MSVDWLNVERALSGTLPMASLTPEEQKACDEKRESFAVGRLAGRMAQGFYAHSAAVLVARDDRVKGFGHVKGFVERADGTRHEYLFEHYRDYLSSAEMAPDLARTWLVGALLNVGDALAKVKYLDHAPELELLYHLRNGVAHGNRFTFRVGRDTRGLDRLAKYAAHNRLAANTIDVLEVTPAVEGMPVLFDFAQPTAILELLCAVEMYLTWLVPRGRSLAHPSLPRVGSGT